MATTSPDSADKHLPEAPSKPTMIEALENYLGFTFPQIPYPQTAKNFDKAAGMLVLGVGEGLTSLATGVADVGTAVTGAGASWLRRRTKLAEAEVAAQIQRVKQGAKTTAGSGPKGDEAIVDRAMGAAVAREAGQQKNRERVLEFAVSELESSTPVADAEAAIDSDWLNMFSDIVANKSSEDIQSLWGKLLAGEIRRPGSVKLRTLHALSLLEASEAQLVYDALQYTVEGRYLFSGQGWMFLSYQQLLDLDDLGVVHFAGAQVSVDFAAPEDGGHRIFISPNQVVRSVRGEGGVITLPNLVPLTSFGKDLYVLAQADTSPMEVAVSVAHEFKNFGHAVELCALGPIGQDGRRVILSKTPL